MLRPGLAHAALALACACSAPPEAPKPAPPAPAPAPPASEAPPTTAAPAPDELDLPRIPGVSREELIRRQALEPAIGELGAKLEREESATFGGLWIESTSEFRVVVAFTRDGEATLRRHVAGTPLAKETELRAVEHSLAALSKTQQEVGEKLRGLGVPVDSSVDVKQNRVTLMVTDREAFDAALAKAKYTLPKEVVVETIYEPVGDDPPFPVGRDPAVAFPQLRMRSGAMMQALLSGTLTLADNCLRVTSDADKTGHLVIWQADYYLHRKGDALEILDREGKPVARVGERIDLGGGSVPLSPELSGQLKQPVPERCKGPYWVMGELVAAQ